MSQIMEMIDPAHFENTKSALKLIQRLKIDKFDVPPVSNMLLIETLMNLFFTLIGPNRNLEEEEVFNSTWKLLTELSSSMSSFSFILRKTLEKLAKISVPENPDKLKKSKKVNLLSQLENYSKSNGIGQVMGVGQIGNGVKRIKMTSDENEKLEHINFTISLFISSITNQNEFDRVNALAGYVKGIIQNDNFNGFRDFSQISKETCHFERILIENKNYFVPIS